MLKDPGSRTQGRVNLGDGSPHTYTGSNIGICIDE